jgi:glutathione S-transferase
VHPEPNLFGSTPYELAYVESRNRHLELELWTQIGISWVNGPIVGRLGRFKQIKEAKEVSDKNTEKFYERLNDELAVTQFVAGDRFTIADITLLTAIDFATAMVDLKPDPVLTNLYRWHKEVSERPSSKI